jgi:hypothetical protein
MSLPPSPSRADMAMLNLSNREKKTKREEMRVDLPAVIAWGEEGGCSQTRRQ